MGRFHLTADELGQKGEARFREICADAKLSCNKSDRDITGWDFIVEFPFETNFALLAPLESRATPLSCHIQIKTILDKNDSVKMRLTAAERLAKEIKPAFIYVLKVNSDLKFTSAHLIHLADEPLATILKRLRKEDATGNREPNQKTIAMSAARHGVEIVPEGKALKEALINACGNDVRAYAAKKAQQLEKLGLGERPVELKMTIKAGSIGELVDAFLGAKTNVDATNVITRHRRFGIPLPIPGASGEFAKITIQPAPYDSCQIVFRSSPLSTPIIFPGQVYVPAIPNLSIEHWKMLIQTDLFSITHSRDTLNIKTAADSPPQTPSTWASYWRLCRGLARGEGNLRIIPQKIKGEVSLDISKKVPGIDENQCDNSIHVCEMLEKLFKFSGINKEPIVKLEEIYENYANIEAAHRLLNPEITDGSLSFKTNDFEALRDLGGIDMLFADFFTLGGVSIAYFGTANWTGSRSDDHIDWVASSIALKRMAQLRSFPSDYAPFVEAAKIETGCSNALVGHHGLT